MKLPPGANMVVRVYCGPSRARSRGRTKWPGRSGKKASISRKSLLPRENMPYTCPWHTVDIVLNPLGFSLTDECGARSSKCLDGVGPSSHAGCQASRMVPFDEMQRQTKTAKEHCSKYLEEGGLPACKDLGLQPR